jgi:predicted amidohydrolase YtcJ
MEADFIVHNATVYTVNGSFDMAESFAVKDGKILEIGPSDMILKKYHSDRLMDMNGMFIYPGLVDAHCHFYGYGMNLNDADLVGTTSFEEIIEILKNHHAQNPTEWILGRGWDQNDWPVKEFPTRDQLDAAFPDNPVYLRRIDGHGAIANTEALERAGITEETSVEGGQLIRKDGRLTGVLIDNAMGLVGRIVPGPTQDDMVSGLLMAQKNCFAVGLTAVHDAGLSKGLIELMDSLHNEHSFKMRVYAMMSPSKENFETYLEQGVYETDRLTVRSIKLFADGALGSRGALMIEPYSDDPGNHGLLVTEKDRLVELCQKAYDAGYQVNTHCIGDSANRLMLRIYADILQGQNDRRWRIEHAQIIHPDDFSLFGQYNIVPSIQTTHATSDMYWAGDRIGPERMKGAYAYKTLLVQNGWIPNGSDFPVEHINPLFGFYAAVARQDLKEYPTGGFQTEEALSRKEALQAMTIWAAKSGFNEEKYGSLEPGKFADFIVMGTDIMTCDIHQVPGLKIHKTYIQGEEVYSAEE